MKNKPFYEYLIQASLIIFSVLLALFLNEYRSNLKEEQVAEKILTDLLDEVKRNQKAVKSFLPYHEKVIENITEAADQPAVVDSIFTEDGFDFFHVAPNGIAQELIVSTAWETAKMNPAIYRLDQALLKKLTSTYGQQKLTFEPMGKIMNLLNSREMFDPKLKRQNLVLLQYQFFELRGREVSLLTYYDHVLKSASL